jgi:hypothetical protein
MAYRTATFDGEAAFAVRGVATGSGGRVLRALARHLALGAGAVVAVVVSGAAVIFCAVWLLGTAGVTHSVSQKQAYVMKGPGTLALGYDPTPTGTTGSRFATTFETGWTNPQSHRLAGGRPMIVAVPESAPRPPVVAARTVPVEVARLEPLAVSVAAAIVPLPPARAVPAHQELARLPAAQPVHQPAPQLASLAAPALPAAIEKRVAPQLSPGPMGTLPESVSRTAVYDITTSTVYMPNGEKMEAHSGLYDKMDDPRHIKVRMRGPTPPNVYVLTERESLFHGVRAIRLNPVDREKMYGRDGMLAHTYMLGPNGQSNGCVSFKDYDKFLEAFLAGKVDKLVVVASLGGASWKTAALQAEGVSVPSRRFASVGSRARVRSYPSFFRERESESYSPQMSYAPSERGAGNL